MLQYNYKISSIVYLKCALLMTQTDYKVKNATSKVLPVITKLVLNTVWDFLKAHFKCIMIIINDWWRILVTNKVNKQNLIKTKRKA